MQTTIIKQKLHQFIDSLEDRKVEAIYTLFENEMETVMLRHKLVMEEREKYLKGEGTSYSWEEVKQMAGNKERRNEVLN